MTSERADIPIDEVITAAREATLLDLHTCMPGIVKAYDASTGRANVQPAVKVALKRENGSRAFESLPLIQNVRVCWPGAGDFELHLPRAQGDTVWLMFSEVDASRFESTGQESPPAWLERLGLCSPVAYPYNRLPKATTGGARMVCPSPFVFGNPLTAEFVALQSQLTALKTAIASAAATEVGASGLSGMTALNTALSTAGWPTGPGVGPSTKLKAEPA